MWRLKGNPKSSAADQMSPYARRCYGRSSGVYTVIMPPARPHLRAALQLRYSRLHVVDVDHVDAIQPLGERCVEIGKPIVLGPEDLR